MTHWPFITKHIGELRHLLQMILLSIIRTHRSTHTQTQNGFRIRFSRETVRIGRFFESVGQFLRTPPTNTVCDFLKVQSISTGRYVSCFHKSTYVYYDLVLKLKLTENEYFRVWPLLVSTQIRRRYLCLFCGIKQDEALLLRRSGL